MIPLYDNNPTRRRPILTVGLFAVNVVVGVYSFTLPAELFESFVLQYGAIPVLLTRDWNLLPDLPTHWTTLISSMFMHGGIMHLGGNMLYLWIFGNNVEDFLGHVRFLVFYLICGLAAALSHAAVDLTSSVPMIGASGAISGLLGAYVVLYPRARVVTLVWFFYFLRFVPIPAYVVLGAWFLMQLTGVLSSPAGGIAWFAHIGGFLVGLLLVIPFRHRRFR